MIKKLLLVTFILTAPIISKEIIINSQNKMVKTAHPKSTKRVYLGSFLAKGHLSANEIYRIDAPVEGVIEYLNVHIYEPVEKGRKLVIIKSPKLLELESKYIDTLIEKEYCANEVNRLKPLYEAAVVAKKRFLEAKNRLAKYTTQSFFYYHLLIEWGLSKEQVEKIKESKKPIPEISIYAPISGKVSDMNVYPKMYVERGEHLMTILNPKGAHFEVALPLKIAKRLKPGFELYIGDKPVKIESISGAVDSRTQTVAIHLLPETDMGIMPDEKRNIKLYWPQNAFALPSSAVIDYDDSEAVFVKTQKGFKLVPVTVLGRSSDTVYVVSQDLKTNLQVAVSGVIALKGALEGQADD
ncbi:efflux RND transporter periplasmic adaptor subunit [Hydrogenimonas thermophila]|uniref:efflux RND transporter periplasmic adaptor subunit n=1 Tax=Hydrogenimonas thermophila TaxID=223786 RepID=UPI00293735D2|nr:efflux RND transporter periplasmic adaptor subunit [Hydrogenimonas thermophila]WOE69169.1 efflux RND transporter periplasmic adaptor subunit [Hydrogenimonas thermophila]WOE71679.1 efflux RND transporter periplasmic adaptor subunit [Hydrogenimonas thermophila]